MTKANVTHLDRKKSGPYEQVQISYEALFDQMTDGVLILGPAGSVEFVNGAYERMFGISHIAVKGKSIYQIPNDDLVLAALKTKKTVQGFLKLPFHSTKISVSASPLMEAHQLGGLIAIYREAGKRGVQETSPEKTGEEKAGGLRLPPSFHSIIGSSEMLKSSLQMAYRAARTTSTVLITGESGTGKEIVAKAIHEASDRAEGPFVKVNCGAIPANLLESELFGHEMGAFTGAIKKKIGKFQQADGGTIFLDEIGDMPLEMQVKILRVLQEKEFERVGGNETIRCNLRILAATHRNLEELVEEKRFREDLYYRLNVVPIQLPALRERRTDILPLCQHFIKKACEKTGIPMKQVTPQAAEAMLEYPWPGNIRELENLMERLMVLVEEEWISLYDLPENISRLYAVRLPQREGGSLVNFDESGRLATLEDYEKEIIQHALKQFKSFNQAAKALGITHKTVAFKARKYNLVHSER